MMAIVKSVPATATDGVLMRRDATATDGVLMRRDAAAPMRPPRTDTPKPRLVIFLKSRLGVSPPCLITYSSSVTITNPHAGNTPAVCLQLRPARYSPFSQSVLLSPHSAH